MKPSSSSSEFWRRRAEVKRRRLEERFGGARCGWRAHWRQGRGDERASERKARRKEGLSIVVGEICRERVRGWMRWDVEGC
jgi:hypothetical protein